MKNKFPLISVIMSVYNDDQRVKNSIESILNQEFVDFEFLILDDASTDNTFKVLKSYELKDHRIKIFRNSQNIGLTKSLNILLSYSSGKYIARQDSDDISSPNRFLEQLTFIEKKKLVGCSTRASIYKGSGLIPGISIYFPLKILMSFKNPVIHGSVVLEKKTYLKYKGYDENFYYAQDYKLFYDIIKNNENFKILNKTLYSLNTVNNISSLKFKEQNYYARCVKKGIKPTNSID